VVLLLILSFSLSQSTQNRTSQVETSYNCTARGQYISYLFIEYW